jgi:ribulose-5-phosphate 4-epimerase/fuculose-1-phosphate aldolase
MSDMQALRERVAKACRVLGTLELTKGTTGHISARVPGTDTVLIRARGPGETGVRFTSAEDVILVDLDGKKLDGAPDLDAPQEVFIHTWIYRTRPEVGSVVHAHPATAVLFTICDKPLLPLYGAYDPTGLRLLMEGIPTFPRSVLVSNDALGKELAEIMGKHACLMRGHGITTCGPSIEEATITAIRLNDLAEMNYRAQLLGNPQTIPEEEIEQLLSASKKKQTRDAEDARPPALWRYYCKLTGEEA